MKCTINFILIVSTIIILIIPNNKAYAAEDINYEDNHVIITEHGSDVYLLTSADTLSTFNNTDKYLRSSNLNTLIKVYKKVSGEWVYNKSLYYEGHTAHGLGTIVETNRDIYIYGTSDVFFSAIWSWEAIMAVAGSPLIHLVRILPIILGLIICGIAFRKGWTFLKTQLLGA